MDLSITFKIHPSVQYITFYPPCNNLTKKGVETDSPTSYKQGEGGFKKYVQNTPQAFKIDLFSHPAIFEQKFGSKPILPHHTNTVRVDLEITFKINYQAYERYFFLKFDQVFSSYRFDGHIWHTTCGSTHRVVLETGLKSYVPIFASSLRRSKMEHSVASPSLMAGIFPCFPILSTFFSSYRFDGHIWHTTCRSTQRVLL